MLYHTCKNCKTYIQFDESGTGTISNPAGEGSWTHTTGQLFCNPRDTKNHNQADPDPKINPVEIETVLPLIKQGLTEHEELFKTRPINIKDPKPVQWAYPLGPTIHTISESNPALDELRRRADGATSKATTQNPKDLLGEKKPPLGQVCPVADLHESCAMLDGDLKYGYRNWRQKDVVARIYIDAALRHIHAWEECEEIAEDSGVHHLGHARACLGILLDAQANGNLIDNRAKGVFGRVCKQLEDWVKERVRRHNETGR